MPLTLPVCVRSGWRCFMPAINTGYACCRSCHAAATNGRQVESISPCGACRQVLLEAEQRYGKPNEGLVVRHERGCGGGECRITVAALFWGERSEIKKKSAIVNNGRSSFFIFGYCLSEIRFLTKPLSLRSFLLLLFRQPAVRRGSLLWNGLRNRT